MKIPFPIYLIRIGNSENRGPVSQNKRPSFFLKGIQSLLVSNYESIVKLCDLRFQNFPFIDAEKSIYIIDSEQFHINEISHFFNKTYLANPESYFFFIGQGPTAIPEKYLKLSNDSQNAFVIKGEPEEVLMDCMKELALYLELSLPTRTLLASSMSKTQLAKNYHSFPALNFTRDELDNYQYIFPLKMKSKIYWGHLLATRGCPHTCSFCTNLIRESYGTNFRTKNVMTVIDEIKKLKELGVNAIAFADDDLTADQNYLNSLCDEMTKQKVNIKWTAHARIDECNPELIKKMKLAGCSLLRFGLESGSEKILRYYNKTRRTDLWNGQVKDIIAACRTNDIQTIGLFIIGSPNEYFIDVLRTIRVIFSNPFNLVQLHIFTPFQDTIESRKLKVKDVLQTSYYDPNTGHFSPLGKTKIKLVFCLILVFFYLNPLQLFRTMKNYGFFFVFNISNFSRLIKSFFAIFIQSLNLKTNENKSLSST